MTIQLAVLDIAGTTVQEHGLVYEALRAATGVEDVNDWLGSDKREAIHALIGPASEEEVERVHADFRRRLEAAYDRVPPEPFPGVPETIARLRAKGVKVALTTGFDRAITDGLLARIGWDDGTVDAVVCADDVARGRPAPDMVYRAMELTGVGDPERVLVAGDTPNDLGAGISAGAAVVVGVLTGGLSAEQLGAHRHTHILPGVAQLEQLT